MRVVNPAHRVVGRAERRGQARADADHVEVVRVDHVRFQRSHRRGHREFEVCEPRVELAPAAAPVRQPERPGERELRAAADRAGPQPADPLIN